MRGDGHVSYDDIAQALEKEFAVSSLTYCKYDSHRDCGTVYENRLGDAILTKNGFQPIEPELNAEVIGSLTLTPQDRFSNLTVEESVKITGGSKGGVMDISKSSLATPSLHISNASVILDSTTATFNSLFLTYAELAFTDMAPDSLLKLSVTSSTLSSAKKSARLFVDDLSVRQSQGIISKSVRANRGYSDGSAVVDEKGLEIVSQAAKASKRASERTNGL